MADPPDHCLRGAARLVPRRFGVEAILEHIKIKCAEIHDAIVVDGVVDAVEIVTRVPITTQGYKFGGALEHPPVHFFELLAGQGIASWIEIAEIAQSKAKGVANLAVGFAELGHHALA